MGVLEILQEAVLLGLFGRQGLLGRGGVRRPLGREGFCLFQGLLGFPQLLVDRGGFGLALLQVIQVAGDRGMGMAQVVQLLGLGFQGGGLGHQFGFQVLDPVLQQLNLAGILGHRRQLLGGLMGQRQFRSGMLGRFRRRWRGLRRGRGQRVHFQFAAQAVQPFVAQIRTSQIAQGVVGVLQPQRHQGREGRHQGHGQDGLVQVEVGPALEAAMAGIFLLGGLGADEDHLEVGQGRRAADGRAEGVALVVRSFHAQKDGGMVPRFQPGQGAVGAVQEIHLECGFQGDLVILDESPIAIHDKETLAHGNSLQVDF